MIVIHPKCIQPLPHEAAPVDSAAAIGAEIARSIRPAENPNPVNVPVATGPHSLEVSALDCWSEGHGFKSN